jgi:hypothetical protein
MRRSSSSTAIAVTGATNREETEALMRANWTVLRLWETETFFDT